MSTLHLQLNYVLLNNNRAVDDRFYLILWSFLTSEKLHYNLQLKYILNLNTGIKSTFTHLQQIQCLLS